MTGNCKTTLPVALLLILILEREAAESERQLLNDFTCGSLTTLILEREVVESER